MGRDPEELTIPDADPNDPTVVPGGEDDTTLDGDDDEDLPED